MANELDQAMLLAEPLAQTMGYEILKAEVSSESGIKVLRIFLDKPEPGVTIDDCEQFSRALSTILDVEADLQGRYHLEVSSPGLNRPLVLPKHFQAQVGKIIQVQTDIDFDGRRNFKGELLRVVTDKAEDIIELKVDTTIFEIPISSIRKAQVDFFASGEKHSALSARHSAKKQKN